MLLRYFWHKNGVFAEKRPDMIESFGRKAAVVFIGVFLLFVLFREAPPQKKKYFRLTSEYEKMAYRLIGNYHGRESHH